MSYVSHFTKCLLVKMSKCSKSTVCSSELKTSRSSTLLLRQEPWHVFVNLYSSSLQISVIRRLLNISELVLPHILVMHLYLHHQISLERFQILRTLALAYYKDQKHHLTVLFKGLVLLASSYSTATDLANLHSNNYLIYKATYILLGRRKRNIWEWCQGWTTKF